MLYHLKNHALILLIILNLLMQIILCDSIISANDEATDSGDDDALCPRNRDEASSRGRQCLRKCKTDDDCISTRKRCLCDGLCGWSCVRPDLNCDELTPIKKGHFKLNGNFFGARVTYYCDDGFIMSGTKERVCQGDGSWSDSPPQCKKQASCGPPMTPLHSQNTAPINQTEFPIDSQITYSCFIGYQSKGSNIAKCLYFNGTTQWFGPELECKPKSCGHPGEVENAIREGNEFTFTSKVSYLCNPGYEIIGRTNRYCQSDGQWSHVKPSCKPVHCPIPEDPLNGRALYTSVSFGSTVRYECRHQFSLVGNTTRVCGAKTEWEGETPVCKEIDCGLPGVLHNGHYELERTVQGSIVYFKCYEGMIFVGENSSVCLSNGSWSNPLPKCLVPCIVPDIENGKINQITPGAKVTHGQMIKIDCKHQYEQPNNVSISICNNGTWTQLPKCVPARCTKLPEQPKNGIVIAPKTNHGIKALYRCKDGFKLEGNNITECNFGNWTSLPPKCVEIYCPFPGFLENGKVLLIGHMGMYDYRPYVKKIFNNKQILYECDKGFILDSGPPGSTCVDGQWSPKEFPKCVKGSHPKFSRVVRSINNRRKFIKQFQDENDSNYKNTDVNDVIHTKKKRKRKFRKRRHNTKLDCKDLKETRCMKVAIVKNGIRNNSYSHGTIVRLSCSKGYHLNIGNTNAECSKGMWKPKEPNCIINSCLVPYIENGHFVDSLNSQVLLGQKVNHNDTIHIKCSNGYQSNGGQTMKCLYGEWTFSQNNQINLHTFCIERNSVINLIIDKMVNDEAFLKIVLKGKDVTEKRWCRPPEKIENILKYHQEEENENESLIGIVQLNDSEESSIGTFSSTKFPINYLKEKTTNPIENNYYDFGKIYEEIKKSFELTKDGDNENNSKYNHGTEIVFKCIPGVNGLKTTWKIVCEDGSWIGKAFKCDEDSFEFNNKSCFYKNPNENVLVFCGDELINHQKIEKEFFSGTELTFRCVDIGKFNLIGSIKRKCINGEWDGENPICYGLSQQHDYALEMPPTILFRRQLGSIAQSPDGKLIIYPGTILHLECLWLRKYGKPIWKWTHQFASYNQDWTTESDRDNQLEYQLSIIHARKEDSGVYTCITPNNYRHSVEIVVKAVHCPVISGTNGLLMSNSDNKMNTKVVFSCENGMKLNGTDELICLPSGHWSSPIPNCILNECPDLSIQSENNSSKNSLLKIISNGKRIGDSLTFLCPLGYSLIGSKEMTCLETGQWSDAIPFCEEVFCESPSVPLDGYIQGEYQSIYRGGDIVQFECNSGYMIEGNSIIICQDNQRWSGATPKCVSACAYPGTMHGGTISLVKFFYSINESVTFDCVEGYEIKGAKVLKCLETGHWSSSVPECQFIKENNNL